MLRSSEEPRLSRAQLQRIARSQRAHAEYKRYKDSLEDSDDDDGPQNDDAWLYEDLTILGKLYTRLRDRQQLMELMFEVLYFCFDLTHYSFSTGYHSRSSQGYYHDFLYTPCAGVQGGKHCRLVRGFAKLCE